MKPGAWSATVRGAAAHCGAGTNQVSQRTLAAACGVDRSTWQAWRAGGLPRAPTLLIAEAVLSGWQQLVRAEPKRPKPISRHHRYDATSPTPFATVWGAYGDARAAQWRRDPASLTMVCLVAARPGLLQLFSIAGTVAHLPQRAEAPPTSPELGEPTAADLEARGQLVVPGC